MPGDAILISAQRDDTEEVAVSTGTESTGTHANGSDPAQHLSIGPQAAPHPRNTQVGTGIKLGPLRKALADDNVSAPAEQVPALREVVEQAKKDGYDVHFVVLTERQPVFTNYRDIATALQQETSGTVIVIGPNAGGSASNEFSRVTLEQATDNLKFTDQTQAAKQMYEKMTEPSINWTVVTLILVLIVVIGGAAARVLGRRRGGAQADAAGPGEQDAQAAPEGAAPGAGPAGGSSSAAVAH